MHLNPERIPLCDHDRDIIVAIECGYDRIAQSAAHDAVLERLFREEGCLVERRIEGRAMQRALEQARAAIGAKANALLGGAGDGRVEVPHQNVRVGSVFAE